MRFPVNKLSLVHLQITKQCNLRCYFCGQWGEKGFFAKHDGGELTSGEWLNVIDALESFSADNFFKPSVMLWGGEPLIQPDFASLAKRLKQGGFPIGLVTNGVALDKYSELIKRDFETVYVSVDGLREEHDSIRGEGVFDRVINNVQSLRGGRAKTVFMTALCPENIESLPDMVYALSEYGPDKILLGELIRFDSDEIAEYTKWLWSCFQIRAHSINSWPADTPVGYEKMKNKKVHELLDGLKTRPAKCPVSFLRHGRSKKHCFAPFRHIHIAWNGSVSFCTDFPDFSAGNIRDQSLPEIWNGKPAEMFRRQIVLGNCPACDHCAWRTNRSYKFD